MVFRRLSSVARAYIVVACAPLVMLQVLAVCFKSLLCVNVLAVCFKCCSSQCVSGAYYLLQVLDVCKLQVLAVCCMCSLSVAGARRMSA